MEQSTRIGSLFRQAMSQITQSQPQLTLKENQVVLGSVLKLFPNDKALVQIGHSTAVAQLETAIKANESYWFTVKGSENLGLKLKIMKQVDGQHHLHSRVDASKDLLRLFQLRITKQNLALTNEVIKENIPVTKEQLQSASEILNHMPKVATNDTVQAIILAIKRHYPLTNDVIRSIMAAHNHTTLSSQIEELLHVVQSVEKTLPSVKQLSNNLIDLTEKQTDMLSTKVMNFLKNPEQLEGLSSKNQAVLHQLSSKLEHISNEQIKGALVHLLNKNNSTSLQLNNHSIQLFTEGEAEFIHNLATKLPLLSTKDEVLQLIKSIDKQIGLSDERALWQKLTNGEKIDHVMTLKNNLISASNDVTSPIIKEQIDQLIYRLNGHMLLQNENSPIQQIMTTIPLFMNQHQTDLTIQWNGKKQADGKIDADFCRILFYLQLPQINDVMIDVQIQNRIMNISIRNNHHSLATLVEKNSSELKEVLSKMNYHVTSIHVKPFEEKVIEQEKIKTAKKAQYQSKYIGVDLKI